MSVTLTYDGVLSRVQIAATGLGTAPYALIERSTNQVVWTTVRGGAAAAVTAGACSLSDYEFVPNVVNYYRVTTPKAVTFVNKGAASHGDNTALDPALPAGIAAGDLLLCLTAIRNAGGAADVPGGYTALVSFTYVKLCAKIAGSSETAPHCTYVGVAGNTTSAQVAAFRNARLSASGFATMDNSVAAQNIALPALPVELAAQLVVAFGQKHDDWTSVATLSGFTEIDEPSTTTGNDQGLVWDYKVETVPSDIAASSFVVTGGAAAISKGAVVAIEPDVLQQTNSITPSISTVWVKSIRRPFLNTAVRSVGLTDITRRDRTGVFRIVGRSLPVAVTDVRGSREFTLRLLTQNTADRDRIDLVLASGDPLFLHVPPTYPTGSLYAVVGDSKQLERVPQGVLTVFELPVIEVAAPGPDLVGATATYQNVLSGYATYTALLAGEPTYQDVVERIGDPVDVIVP